MSGVVTPMRDPAPACIRPMTPEDWPGVRAAYLDGIATGDATFESEAPSWEAWDRSHPPECRLVAERDGTILGFAALARISARKVYEGVAEVSVYVAAGARGQGIGRRLLDALVASSEAHGFWTLQAGIFPENAASMRLHEGVGFRVVGVRERIGRTAGGCWRDVVLLERRTPAI